MPLVRLEVRNEYGLGDPELYKKSLRKEDPKAILDGIAVAGLVGILRQLGDLADLLIIIHFSDVAEEEASVFRIFIDEPGYGDLHWLFAFFTYLTYRTDEQQKKWLPLAYKMQIIGCYAQTELGHGSNVQGLETTATFDPKTDEFVTHNPTLTSSKVSQVTREGKYVQFDVLRQFGSQDGSSKTQVIDYKTQQSRLFPLLASAYAFRFVGQWLKWLYNDVTERLRANDFSTLPEAHACTAGLKSLTTSFTNLKYSRVEIDEVRFEWAECMLDYI
ncbi:hypothetical protein ZIOFF_029718 [Zingiber officinale]|uniref:Uncharacterized protein n=1 Tax=Zingiber officinale TaxID=94328 RepID=A0A8J5GU79_ZINOF|nr:hypothetical protein ZIOFF_029718 [Zingiber officinale]